MIAGLCSITLRALGPDDVIATAVAAGLGAIEWGADVHVPPGDVARADALARRCAEAGLACPSYGSYLLAGGVDLDPLDAVLDAAQGLGASLVRVWTPFGVTPTSDASEQAAVADALREVCARADERGLQIGLEFHPGTLTHTATAANALLDSVAAHNLLTYWQPMAGPVPDRDCLAELDLVQPRLAHLHVFSWGPGGIEERLALAARAGLWAPAIVATARATREPEPALRGERAAFLEYVPDDDPAAVVRDAATLRTWIDAASA